MKPVESIRRLEARHLVALTACCGLAVFIGFMLTGQFLYQSKMNKERDIILELALEKRVSAMAYFFSERYSDLENLKISRELTGYFENQALGMSMKYGLGFSMGAAARRFSQLRASKRIGGDVIYRRIVFIRDDGKVLIDTLGKPDTFPSFCAGLLAPGKKEKVILGTESDIAVALPFTFKGKYRGILVSFLAYDAIDRHLVRHIGDNPCVFRLASDVVTITQSDLSTLKIDPGFQVRVNDIPENGGRIIREWNGDQPGLLALRGKVPDTPFSIVCLFQNKFLSYQTVFTLVAVMISLLVAAIFFIWRSATQKLIFGVRRRASAESDRRFRDLVEFLPVPIAEYDFNLKLRYANQTAADFFGYSKDEIAPGMDLFELIPEARHHLVMERMDQVETGAPLKPLEVGLLRRDGSQVWGKLIRSVVHEKDKKVGILACFVDLTQQMELERETIRAAEQEKFALVGQVAGKMAHDFNNILSAIMGNAELCLLDCSDQEVYQTLGIILEQAKRGNILTRNLVAFAKDQEIREEYFNVNEKMDLVLNLLKKELEGVTVIKKYGTGLPDLLADPGMIEHALVNLVQNSVHAMGKTAHPVLGVSTECNENSLTIVIQDNGCGIPEAYFDEIYSPSFSLKGSRDVLKAYKPGVKGTGYGLFNVRKYITKHKGELTFMSREGKGTRFSVTLPLVAKSLFPEEKADLQKKQVVRGRHILVVEDEPAIAMVLHRILTSDPFHHRVSLAENAEEALSLMETEGDTIDLVSLDYVLPGERSGLDVYTEIRKSRKQLPVIFISGNMRFLKSIVAMKQSDLFVDHLPKPFENRVYADKVNEWLLADQKKSV